MDIMREAILITPIADMEGWVTETDERRDMVKFTTRLGKVTAWKPAEDVIIRDWSH
jgi:hypothetical protein